MYPAIKMTDCTKLPLQTLQHLHTSFKIGPIPQFCMFGPEDWTLKNVYIKTCFLRHLLLNYSSIYFWDKSSLRMMINRNPLPTTTAALKNINDDQKNQKKGSFSFAEQRAQRRMLKRCLHKASHHEWLAKLKWRRGSGYLFISYSHIKAPTHICPCNTQWQ